MSDKKNKHNSPSSGHHGGHAPQKVPSLGTTRHEPRGEKEHRSRSSKTLDRTSTGVKDVPSLDGISQADTDKLMGALERRISEKTSRVEKKVKLNEEKNSKRIDELEASLKNLSSGQTDSPAVAALKRQIEEKDRELQQLQQLIAQTKASNSEAAAKLAAQSGQNLGIGGSLEGVIEEVKKKYADDLNELKTRIEQNRKDYQDGLSTLNTQIEDVKKAILAAVQGGAGPRRESIARTNSSMGIIEQRSSEDDRKIAEDHRQLSIFKIKAEGDNAHRIQVIREIIDTEVSVVPHHNISVSWVSYVKGLDILCYQFQPALRELQKANPKKISLEDINHLFGNIDELVQFQQLFLSELKTKMKDFEIETGTIGDFFTKYSSFMKSRYAYYCSNYDRAATLLLQLEQVKEFALRAREIMEEKKLPLSLKDYLIMPVQRVPRYALLLADLLKHTPENHPDNANLSKALEKVKEVATNVNLEISQSDQLKVAERLETVFESLQNDYDIWRQLANQILQKGGVSGLKKRHLHHEAALEVALMKGPGQSTFTQVRRSSGNTRGYILTDLFTAEALILGNNKWTVDDVNKFALPLELTWVSSDLRSKLDKKAKAHLGLDAEENAFEIYGPELTLIVVTPNVVEKEAWVSVLKSRIQERLKDTNGTTTRHNLRVATYEYQIGGRYQGSWKEAAPHGHGSYAATSGKHMLIFDGHWDKFLMAGVGTCTLPNQPQTKSGWKNLLPDSHPEMVPTENDEDLATGVDVTEQLLPRDSRDWKVMLTGSETVKFKAGEYVIRQGDVNRILWRIDRGVCSVQKEVDGEKKELGEMAEGKLFGEMSLLTASGGKKATASIVAKSDVTLTKVSYDFIFQLFEGTPGLAKRFYRVCAILQSQKLQSMGKPKTQSKTGQSRGHGKRRTGGPKAPVRTGSKMTMQPQEDEEFRKLFGLRGEEVVIKQYLAQASGIVKKSGEFYISQHYFCFYAKAFGSKTREILYIPSVDKLKRVKKSVRMHEGSKKLVVVFGNEKIAEEAFSTMNSLWSQQKSIDGPKKPILDSSMPMDDEEILTKSDWELVLGGAESVTYQEGDTVMEEGKRYERLFQLSTGELKVVVRGQEVARMDAGQMFGEIGFLEKTPASASIVAASDCKILEIDNSYFNTLFVKHPNIAAKFFHFLATLITGRIGEREEALLKDAEEKKDPKDKDESE